MDWSSYFSAPNNIHNGMPALMADGRVWSSWQPEAVVNSQIQQQEGITSNWQYRQYLQNNAEHIMKYNTNEAIYETGNNPYTNINNQPLGSVPFLYKTIDDKSRPKYGFSNSDLKQQYLAREQLMSKMSSPSINF